MTDIYLLAIEAEPWPLCGMKCDNPAELVDSCGVGLCADHADGMPNPVVAAVISDFDPWWRHSSRESAAFSNLDYGSWPEGYPVPADAYPGWGLPSLTGPS